MKFYKIDDQIVISDKALTVGKELTANTVDAAFEKHVPVIEQNGDTVMVKVGSVEHPSMPEHYIEWILPDTEMGFQIHYREQRHWRCSYFFAKFPGIPPGRL